MLLKENASIEKLNGRYFTPQLIADFVTEWVVDQEQAIKNVLEPSVGGGYFYQVFQNLKTLLIRISLPLKLTKIQQKKQYQKQVIRFIRIGIFLGKSQKIKKLL